MDLGVETTTVTGLEDRSWLGSAHGTEATDTVTLDLTLFTAATHFPNGEIRSGTVLARVTATGLYGPYDNAVDVDPVTAGQQSDGRDVARGHLFNTIRVRTGQTRAGAPLMTHGKVRVANLPANHGLDAPARADLPLIQYID